MLKFNVIVIGGGPAGVSAALSARNTYPDKTIAIVRKEEIPMIPCGIPYLFHSLANVDDNILPDKPLIKHQIEVIIDEVVDVQEKTLRFISGKEIEFEKLVLAVGSSAFVPQIKGIEKEGVCFVKKERDYLITLKKSAHDATKIIIIGGGFIGLEVADELLKAEKNVVVIETLDHLLPLAMDVEFGKEIEENLREQGAEVYTATTVVEICGDKKVEGVKIASGEMIEGDLVIVAAGYRPNLTIAQKMGLRYNPRFGIIVDEYLRTSEKDIFAIGDCAAKRSSFTGEYYKLMLASTAMAEGRLVGSNLYQMRVIRKYLGALGSFSTKICGVSYGVSGLTEIEAQKMGVDYVLGTAETFDRHPGKLPGASKLFVKLIFSKYSHVLMGGEVKGGDSVGEIVNMLATMIQNNMTDMEIDTLQIGTHPLLTPSPVAYPIINATAEAILKMV